MFKKATLVILAGAALALPLFGQERGNPNPVFSLDLSQSVEAKGAKGEVIAPKSGGLRIPGGIAAPAPDKRPLVYDIKDVLKNDQGTIMFWTLNGSITAKNGKDVKFAGGIGSPFLFYQMAINGEKGSDSAAILATLVTEMLHGTILPCAGKKGRTSAFL